MGARVEPSLHRDHVDRAREARVGGLVNPNGSPLDRDPERACDLVGERPTGRLEVEHELSVAKALGVEIAEDEVGVSDGGLGAALAITSGARRRARSAARLATGGSPAEARGMWMD